MLTEFTHCLHRVAKIGNYYPAGHAIVDQAAAAFLVILGKIAHANSTVLLEVEDDCLLVDTNRVETNTKSKTELLKILQEAAIGSILISRHATIDETLEFVRLILSHRGKFRYSSNFSQSDLSTMPDSFKVQAKQFLVDKTAVISSQTDLDSENALNNILEALEDKGLTKTQTAQCRSLLNSLQKSYRPIVASNSTIQFTWNDVQNLLLNVIRNKPVRTGQGGNRVQNDINTLTTIFGHLETTSEDPKTKDSIGFLISLIKSKPMPMNKGNKFKPKKRTADQAPELSIKELQHYIDKAALPPAILKKLSQTDKAEEVGFLLQLLQQNQTSEAMRTLNRFLQDIFNRPLTPKEKISLLESTRLFFTLNLNNRLKAILPSLVLIMRQSNHFSSLNFLSQLLKNVSKQQLLLLWPIIVNEMMAVGMGEKPKIYMHLLLTCSQLSWQEMMQQKERLEKFDSFQKHRAAAALYPGATQENNLLFSFLLSTSLKKTVYQTILPVLKKTPPDPLASAVFPFLLDEENHLTFLHLYFAHDKRKPLAPSLRKLTGAILLEGLSHLPEESMEEPWVLQSILYCGQTPVEGMSEMLNSIINTKKMLIMFLWPTQCRQAAQKALNQLNKMVKR